MDFEGNAIENVYHFRVETAGNGNDQDLMTDIAQWLDDAYDHLAPNTSSNLTYVEIRGFNVTDLTPMPTVAWPSQTVGGSGSSALPLGTALLVLFRTGISRVLGRKFLGGLTEDSNSDGAFDSGMVATAAAYAAELLASVVGAETGSSLVYGILRAGGTVLADVITAVADSEPGYQRRRRRGRGD
jgi:hypothetical protein